MKDYSKRSYVVVFIFLLVGVVFLIRLASLQLLDPTYKQFATRNVLREITQYPARGLIYDRNGRLLVYNRTAYDLMVTPREVEPFDTTLFCTLLAIPRSELEAGLRKARRFSRYKPSLLIKQISPERFAVFQEQLYKFKGFHAQTRTLREYTTTAAAHALGYVGEVTAKDIERDPYYKSGDYIGVSGIERTYEVQLRGTKGVKKYLVDVHNRIQGNYLNGKEDVPAQKGKNVVTTLDLDLQLYAEKLFQHKKGAMVALEPATGEVLAIVSAPVYDPRLLVGRVRGANYDSLSHDPLKPLFNRALMARYPPGSTFKIINALIGLQERVINASTRFVCNGPVSSPIRCTHNHISPLTVVDAIRESCNPYLWNTFRSIIGKYPKAEQGFNVWREYALRFGISGHLSADFIHGRRGNIPTQEYYDRYYGRGHWNALTIRSLAIGQGELGITPLEMVNCCAIFANRGFYFEPHIVKEIENDTLRSSIHVKHEVGIDAKYFAPVLEGMSQVANASPIRKIPGVDYCGKTGTIQNPHGEDHSAFIAFAPRENPQIAVFVYVENGGYGAVHAAPMASLMIEKYLNDTIADSRHWLEEKMINSDLINQED